MASQSVHPSNDQLTPVRGAQENQPADKWGTRPPDAPGQSSEASLQQQQQRQQQYFQRTILMVAIGLAVIVGVIVIVR